MRIVLIHRYFWPDSPTYAHILKRIALDLADHGHEVTVLAGRPSYGSSSPDGAPAVERIGDRCTVRRCRVLPDRRFTFLKMVNLVLFCAWLLVQAGKLGTVDVVMAASQPPIAVARTALWLSKLCRARFVYHKQDIYPDVIVTAGILRSRWLAGLLRRADAGTERRADKVVVLSRDMAETLHRRGVRSDRVEIINNFDPWTSEDGGRVETMDPHRGPLDEQLQVVYAGNVGRFQDVATVVAALVRLGDHPLIGIHFFGNGPLLSYVEQQVAAYGLRNVVVHGYEAPEAVAEFLRERADIGIVSLLPGLIRAAYPSRTLSYLRHGCPVLAVVEKDSELAETITAAGAGVQVDPGNAVHLAEALEELAAYPTAIRRARKCAADLYTEQFSARRQVARWRVVFEQVGRRNTT
jgi:colanic acid biosynthesis glycosyl transferase WcaI